MCVGLDPQLENDAVSSQKTIGFPKQYGADEEEDWRQSKLR